MNEFICPNGRMSVNGVCPIFEGDDGQVKDFQKPKTFDDKYDEIEDIPIKKSSGIFEWDLDKPTDSASKSADNIIASNISYYNNFVEDTLGIPSNVQNAFRVGSAAVNIASGGGALGVIGPFALPFVVGGFLKNKENERIQNITDKDSQGDIKTFPTKTMNIQPTPRDIAMGGGENNNNNNQGTFGSSVNEATGARGSGTGFSDYS